MKVTVTAKDPTWAMIRFCLHFCLWDGLCQRVCFNKNQKWPVCCTLVIKK